jgi:hypothetical protein
MDLTTEVTAMIKNLTGSSPVKLTRILIDTGCSKTLIKKQHVPDGLSNAKKAMPITWSTNGGKFNTRYEVPLTIVLPEFSSSMEVQWSCAIDENPDSTTYDMILGRDLQSALRMGILFSTSTLVWNEISIPMHTGKQREQTHLNEYLDQVIEDLSLPEIIREELHGATKILDANSLPDGIVYSMYCILRLHGTPVAYSYLPYSPDRGIKNIMISHHLGDPNIKLVLIHVLPREYGVYAE